MEIYVVFGLPGAGKTFVGKLMQKYFGFYLYDDDGARDMPQEMKDAVVNGTVTDELRDIFFNNLIESVKQLTSKYEKIIVPQTLIKEKYRELFLKEFPTVKFIYVQTNTATREKRLLERKEGFQLDLTIWRKMAEIFENPQIECATVVNNNTGEEDLKKQLQVLLT